MIDFTNLNDVYHLAMIIVGVGMLVLAFFTLIRAIKKDKQAQQRQIKNQKNKKSRR